MMHEAFPVWSQAGIFNVLMYDCFSNLVAYSLFRQYPLTPLPVLGSFDIHAVLDARPGVWSGNPSLGTFHITVPLLDD